MLACLFVVCLFVVVVVVVVGCSLFFVAAAVVELTTATTPAFSTTRGKSYSAGSLIRTARCGEHWKWEEPI